MLYKVRHTTGEYAIDGSDGLKLYNAIHSDLLAGNSVELNFEDVQVFASIFFNFAIGQLLRDLTPNTLNVLIPISLSIGIVSSVAYASLSGN
jgi:STAS-like domain of unknown function (DUF4325)